MKVVLDTNVLFQAFHSNKGASYIIFNLIREEKIKILLSSPVLLEYEEILLRKKKLLSLNEKEIQIIISYIAMISKKIIPHFLWRPNLRDEDDNIFIELAVNGNADWLITNNISDFSKNMELLFHNLKIVTPFQFLQYWSKYENKS